MKSLIFIFLIVFFTACTQKRAEITGMEDKPIPAFKLLLLDSTTYINTAEIPTEKPTVLFYVSPECPFCRVEMTQIVKHIDLLKEIQFYIFSTWSVNDMKQFNARYQLDRFENIKVGIDYNQFFGQYYNVPGVPYMAIYGKDKKLNKAFAGEVDPKMIADIALN